MGVLLRCHQTAPFDCLIKILKVSSGGRGQTPNSGTMNHCVHCPITKCSKIEHLKFSNTLITNRFLSVTVSNMQ